ncbi:MAG: FAD-binding molybdopterin dehydrogenase [Rhodospirillales bacterium 69-11]|nr:MAG: FAD-binding molybdopterin dehydrogenase [Rhodospirillales bacterium 69-11]
MLAFGYAQAKDLDDGIELLRETPAALPIAGGTDVLQLLQEGVIAPSELVDLNLLPLRGIEEAGQGLRIGALTRLSEIADDPRVKARFPVLARALEETASPQVRNMATAAGNLLQRTRCLYFRDVTVPCNKREPGSGCPAMEGENRMNAILGGSPSCIASYPGDMANALLVLDAELEVQGPEGSRRLAVADLHREPGDTPHLETTLRPAEIITAIHLPATPRSANSHYLKLRDRASFEWALVSVAVALEIKDGEIRSARVAAGAVGTTPWRLPLVERRLERGRLDEAAAVAAAEAATHGVSPRPRNAFKVKLLRAAVERVLLMAGGLA